MNYSVRISSGADKDVDQAIDWYEKQRQGLGSRFRRQLLETLAAICANPLRHSKGALGMRKAILKAFPYHVVYTVDERTISIWAIYHTSRDPKQLARRLPYADPE
jgi:plasmid stabilization system protein ParE